MDLGSHTDYEELLEHSLQEILRHQDFPPVSLMYTKAQKHQVAETSYLEVPFR